MHAHTAVSCLHKKTAEKYSVTWFLYCHKGLSSWNKWKDTTAHHCCYCIAPMTTVQTTLQPKDNRTVMSSDFLFSDPSKSCNSGLLEWERRNQTVLKCVSGDSRSSVYPSSPSSLSLLCLLVQHHSGSTSVYVVLTTPSVWLFCMSMSATELARQHKQIWDQVGAKQWCYPYSTGVKVCLHSSHEHVNWWNHTDSWSFVSYDAGPETKFHLDHSGPCPEHFYPS